MTYKERERDTETGERERWLERNWGWEEEE